MSLAVTDPASVAVDADRRSLRGVEGDNNRVSDIESSIVLCLQKYSAGRDVADSAGAVGTCEGIARLEIDDLSFMLPPGLSARLGHAQAEGWG